jgi:3'-5' exoribonuclease
MNTISKEMLGGTHYNGDAVSGIILLKDVVRATTKNGKPFFHGSVCSGTDVSFKAWDNSEAFKMLEREDLAGKVVYISGNWNEYMGVFSIILDTVMTNAELVAIDPMNFIESKYNIDAYWSGLQNIMKSTLTEKGMLLANKFLFENEEVANAFKVEFAAKSHHDNCKAGLLAHTYKVCYLMQVTLNLYKDIVDKDLVMLGVLLHDIGKIKEMHMGVYQPCSKVTHRFLGIEMLDKDLIVENYGEDWYYELVSIMLQHHGEWGDPCKTVSARLVNLVDEFEAKAMLIKQAVDISDNCGTINIDGQYLSYMPK